MEEIEKILDSNYDRETKLKNLKNIQKELDFAKEVINKIKTQIFIKTENP